MATSEKKDRQYFELKDNEYSSREMMYITYTMLESLGYCGMTELASIIKDPETMLRLIRFLNGTTIKVPTLTEFTDCLRASIYTFCDMHKMINFNTPAKGDGIRKFLGINKDKENELLEIFDNWILYLWKMGIDPSSLMHCNRNNTKKRIKMVQNGKKWSSSRY